MNPHKLRVLLWAIGLPLLGQQAESAAATKPGKPSVAEHSLEDLADLLAPIRKQHNMPALGAAVIVDGKLVALGVDGVRKLGDATLVTRDDLWHLGSCTKAMTATLLAQQVALGKLSFATTVGEALPKLRAGMHAESRQITIEQLLQHRSGLPSQPPTAQWLELFDFEGTTIEARREVAATMLAKPPEAKPGERFLYSNAGYMIAGAVLEAVTGKSWQELLQADLFVPLAMQHVGFGPPGRDGHVDQPWGHVTGKRGRHRACVVVGLGQVCRAAPWGCCAASFPSAWHQDAPCAAHAADRCGLCVGVGCYHARLGARPDPVA
jgi:CubicO group peptidase (beta-lactamase class C family)